MILSATKMMGWNLEKMEHIFEGLPGLGTIHPFLKEKQSGINKKNPESARSEFRDLFGHNFPNLGSRY